MTKGQNAGRALAENRYWTYQELAEKLVCHPKTVARWVKALNLKIFHPTLVTVRLPDSEARKLLSAVKSYSRADFPTFHK